MNIKLLPVVLAGCYGSAPGLPPRVPLPTLADGGAIRVHTETKTAMENVSKEAKTCPDGHPEACQTTSYTVAEPVTHTTTTATYAEQPINYAQFVVLTDPKWSDKLTELDELSTRCKRANIPRYAGMGLMLGGVVAGAIVGGDVGKGIIYGGLGGGAAAYTLGFFSFGGRDCVAARQLYDSMDMTRQLGWESVEGQDFASEMKTLAEQFNATRGRRAMQMR